MDELMKCPYFIQRDIFTGHNTSHLYTLTQSHRNLFVITLIGFVKVYRLRTLSFWHGHQAK